MQGIIVQRFHQQIGRSQLRSSGLLIKATLGQAVHAIAPGKVVFANWLSGVGLLVIINHSNGFMSLYGRNQSLTVKQGDMIKTGEIIAHAGRSGGYQQATLYFAIRKHGIPLNPISWLKKR